MLGIFLLNLELCQQAITGTLCKVKQQNEALIVIYLLPLEREKKVPRH